MLGLVLAVVMLGEVPTVFGLTGVALIVAGSYFVVDRVPGQAPRFVRRACDRWLERRDYLGPSVDRMNASMSAAGRAPAMLPSSRPPSKTDIVGIERTW